MERKIISALLSLTLLFTFSINVLAADPIGNLEEVSSERIKGWAYQSDLPDTPIETHIYIKNNSTGSEIGHALFADQYRADLYAAGIGNGYHAFEYDVNWCEYISGSYNVSAYGIHASGGAKPHLANSPTTFLVQPGSGTVDEITDTFIRGWAWKSSEPNTSIQVHLYVRTSDGQTVYAHPVFADQYRPDVYAAGYGNGSYGYSIPVDWSTLPKEELRVTLYAVDASGENPAFYDGYYNNAQPHGIITLYGINHSDTNQRKNYYTTSVQNAVSNIGVTEIKGLYTGTHATTALNRLKESMIWVVHTHGSRLSVLFNHSSSGETEMTYYNLHLLSNDALSSERCVIFGTCSAGEGGNEMDNMVNITYEKGAMTVIGWTNSTYVAQMNTWLKSFFIASGNGMTISSACAGALDSVIKEFGEDYLGGLDNLYIKGSTTQKLIS